LLLRATERKPDASLVEYGNYPSPFDSCTRPGCNQRGNQRIVEVPAQRDHALRAPEFLHYRRLNLGALCISKPPILGALELWRLRKLGAFG
jgi:hypothetical protein